MARRVRPTRWPDQIGLDFGDDHAVPGVVVLYPLILAAIPTAEYADWTPEAFGPQAMKKKFDR